jgi:hypothetical protein
MLLITLIFIIAGVATFLVGLYYMKMGKESLNWIPIKAQVLNKGELFSRGSGGKTSTHKYFIWYQYNINNVSYRSKRLSFKPALIPTYKLKERFKDKEYITVYYSPENHKYSVIDQGIDRSNYLFLVASPFFIFIGVSNLIWG